jgi:hypothetical protein
MGFILPISQLSGTMPVGYSTLDNLFVLFNFFEILKNKKNKMFCAFIDFEKAFDKVWRDGLWYKLLLNNMYKITKSFRYIPSWVSISLEIVCNPFKLQFVKYDSRSFMNTAKRKRDKFSP